MKLVLISDTHGKHRELQLPQGDILIHAGDFSMIGEEETVKDFNLWLGEQSFKHKLVQAGNHDLGFERDSKKFESMLTNCRYLRDETINIEGLKMFFSPYTPFFSSDYWVFQKHGMIALKEHWKQIPENLDLLVTHGPPSYILDRTLEGKHAGDVLLLERLYELKYPPVIHCFGHIHEGYGSFKSPFKKIGFLNISVLDREYRLTNPPTVVEL